MNIIQRNYTFIIIIFFATQVHASLKDQAMHVLYGQELKQLICLAFKTSEDQEDPFVCVPVNRWGASGVILAQATTNKTFALNAINTTSGKPVGGKVGSSGGAGIVILEDNKRVGGITLDSNRKAWYIQVPNCDTRFYEDLCSFVTSQENVMIGVESGGTAVDAYAPINYTYNVAIGSNTLYKLSNTATNSYNTVIGYSAGAALQGGANICIGAGAMMGNRNGSLYIYSSTNSAATAYTWGNNNIGMGTLSLASLSGDSKTLQNNQNIGIGLYAGFGWVSGSNNTFIGTGTATNGFNDDFTTTSLTFPTQDTVIHVIPNYSGNNNIAFGYLSMQRVVGDTFTGNKNICIGTQSGANIGPDTSEAIFIGAVGPNVALKGTYINNIYATPISALVLNGATHTVSVNKDHQLGIVGITKASPTIIPGSVETYKGGDGPLPGALNGLVNTELYNLTTMTFRYSGDSQNALQYGMPADVIVQDSSIITLASLAVSDPVTGNVVAYDNVGLIPLLVVAFQQTTDEIAVLNTDIAGINSDITMLIDQISTINGTPPNALSLPCLQGQITNLQTAVTSLQTYMTTILPTYFAALAVATGVPAPTPYVAPAPVPPPCS